MNKILVSGVTGFIGAQLAINLTQMGYQVIGLKRTTSDLSRLYSVKSQIVLLNSDDVNWMDELLEIKPTFIIHCAWEGVSAADRDNWNLQFGNFKLLNELLNLCKLINVKKFISLGSQAEYGDYIAPVSENLELNPNSNYGFLKNVSHEISSYFLRETTTKLIWLRLFPLFGVGESDNWFIPMLVKRLTEDKTIDMTLGEQKYAYLFINDFCSWINIILSNDIDMGVYNISSINNIYSLKTLVNTITQILNIENPKINFGAIPYRKNQNMELIGDMSKLQNQLSNEILSESNFESSLKSVIESLIIK